MPTQLVISLSEHEGNLLDLSEDGGLSFDVGLVDPADQRYLTYTGSHVVGGSTIQNHRYEFGPNTTTAFVHERIARMNAAYEFNISYQFEQTPKSSLPPARPRRTITEALSTGPSPQNKKAKTDERPRQSNGRLLRKIRM